MQMKRELKNDSTERFFEIDQNELLRAIDKEVSLKSRNPQKPFFRNAISSFISFGHKEERKKGMHKFLLHF